MLKSMPGISSMFMFNYYVLMLQKCNIFDACITEVWTLAINCAWMKRIEIK